MTCVTTVKTKLVLSCFHLLVDLIENHYLIQKYPQLELIFIFFALKFYYTVDNYVNHVKEALDMAHQQMPKTLVQIVPTYDMTPLHLMATDMACDFIQKYDIFLFFLKV